LSSIRRVFVHGFLVGIAFSVEVGAGFVHGFTGTIVEMLKPSQEARFGDFQANCAMPLAKQLKKPPRDVASELVAKMDVADLCEPLEVAGRGLSTSD